MQETKIQIIKKILLILPVLISILVYFYGYYITADDSMMNGLLTGNIISEEHLIFINTIMGWICKTLYGIYSGINWFGIVYLFMILLCTYSIFFIIKKYTSYIIALCLCICMELFAVTFFTFTTIGYCCTIVGFMFFIELLSDSTLKKNVRIIYQCLMIILIASGIIVRESAFVSALFIISPMIILYFIKTKNKKKAIFIGTGIIIVITSMWTLNKISYNNDYWSKYLEYNGCRSAAVDYPILDYKGNENKFREIGISKNDYNCLRYTNGTINYLCGDKNNYSAKTLKDIVRITNPVKYNYKNWILQLIHQKSFYFYLIVMIVLLIADKGKKRIFYLVETMVVFASILYLFVIQRALPRVYISIFVVGALTLIYYYLKNHNEVAMKIRLPLLAILTTVIFATGFSGIEFYGEMQLKRDYVKKTSELRAFISSHRDVLYIMSPFDLDYTYYNLPIKEIGEINSKNILPIFDWNSYDKNYYEKTKKYKFQNKDSILLSLVDNASINYVYFDENPIDFLDDIKRDDLQRIKAYIEEKTNKKIIIKKIQSLKKEKVSIYRFVSSNE